MKFKNVLLLSFMLLAGIAGCENKKTEPVSIGVYYFDGWSGKHRLADDPNEPWAKNAPATLTKRIVEEFPRSEPVWGWRNDTQEIMERQIDLAADHGIDFFAFCWYWKDNKGSINPTAIENYHLNTSLELYLTAGNKKRLKYSLLVANYEGADIVGVENWKEAVRYWAKYFKDPQYITVGGKPLVAIFDPWRITNEELAEMQEVAKKEGFPNGLAIAGCRPIAKTRTGFTHSTDYNTIHPAGWHYGSSVVRKYEIIINNAKAEWWGTEQQPFIPCITEGFDNRPRERKTPDGAGEPAGWYYIGNSPEKFKNFLTDAIQWMDDHPNETTKERLVMIYAWNEMSEGSYLVPTKGDPDATKLKVIKNVVNK
jgi:hypothetical protein